MDTEIIIQALSIEHLTNAFNNIQPGITVIVEVSENTLSIDNTMSILTILNPPVNLVVRNKF